MQKMTFIILTLLCNTLLAQDGYHSKKNFETRFGVFVAATRPQLFHGYSGNEKPTGWKDSINVLLFNDTELLYTWQNEGNGFNDPWGGKIISVQENPRNNELIVKTDSGKRYSLIYIDSSYGWIVKGERFPRMGYASSTFSLKNE